MFRAFRIGPDGTLTQGPNSPLRLAKGSVPGRAQGSERVARRTRVESDAEDPLRAGGEPLADDHLPLERSGAADVRARDPEPAFVPAVLDASSMRPARGCTPATPAATTSRVFDISRDPTRPREIQAIKLDAPGNPWNFQLDPSGRVIFLLDMRAVAQIPRGPGQPTARAAYRREWPADRGAVVAGEDPGPDRHQPDRARGRAGAIARRSAAIHSVWPLGPIAAGRTSASGPIASPPGPAANQSSPASSSCSSSTTSACALRTVSSQPALTPAPTPARQRRSGSRSAAPRRRRLRPAPRRARPGRHAIAPALFALQPRLFADDVARGLDQEVDRLGLIGKGQRERLGGRRARADPVPPSNSVTTAASPQRLGGAPPQAAAAGMERARLPWPA